MTISVGSSSPSNKCLELLNIKLTDLFWIFCFNLLLFQAPLKNFISLSTYFDEGATLFLSAATLLFIIRRTQGSRPRLSSTELFSLLFLVLLVFVGLLGNFKYKFQTDYKPILIDIFACVKFVLMYLCGIAVLTRNNRFYSIIVIEIKILLLLILPFAVLNQFIDMGMRFDERYGFYSFQFIFGHPATLAEIVAGFILLLLVDFDKNKLFLVIALFLMVSTLRSTAISFVAAVIVICINGTSKNARFCQLALILFAGIYLGWSQIQYYYFALDGSARARLTTVSIQIAQKYSPIGSGFATFASNITAQPGYYSSLYYQYGLNTVFGLIPGDISFLSDTFWPIVIGQFGWLGLALFVGCIVCLLMGRLKFNSARFASNKITILLFVYLGLASMGSTAFFHPSSAFLVICFAIANSGLLASTDPQ